MLNLSDVKEELRKRTGIKELCLEDEKLETFIRGRLSQWKLRSSREYIAFLDSEAPSAHQEVELLIKLVSNTESFFFRDHGQMDLLRSRILPGLIEAKKPGEKLRVLSAACSTGEELYSICIMLHEFHAARSLTLDLTGVDINHEALKKAREGLYSPWSFRGVPNTTIEKYFKIEKGKLRLSPEIRSMAKFRYFNLVDGAKAFPAEDRFEKFDLIVCRNVFIYFDDEAINRSVKGLLELLKEGGYLLTGHSELANKHFETLQIVQFPESFIGKKVSGTMKAERSVRNETNTLRDSTGTTFTRRKTRSKGVEKIRMPFDSMTITPDTEPMPEEKPVELARIEADLGNADKAKIICDSVIEKDPFNFLAYFTLAQIANEQGEIEEAMLLLNKVIYLNSRYYPAYIELATIHNYLGNHKTADRFRRNAISELEMLDPSSISEIYSGMTVAALLEELKQTNAKSDTNKANGNY